MNQHTTSSTPRPVLNRRSRRTAPAPTAEQRAAERRQQTAWLKGAIWRRLTCRADLEVQIAEAEAELRLLSAARTSCGLMPNTAAFERWTDNLQYFRDALRDLGPRRPLHGL